MAKTKLDQEHPKKREKFQDWKNTRWVMNNLNEEQLAAMDETPFDAARAFDWFAHLVDNGVDVKMSWDDWSQCYSMTIQGAFLGFVNAGYACSARSPEGYEDCTKILWYKFEYLANGDMSQAYEKAPKRGKRG